eukprot:CAMPEP_0113605044 /NCGR_PEP_ID=MMETSP0017_2-20120614/2116_1 /TAXON_ID=2856 /ORGANISM="Cylindrotheca closterium" /LENGTH=402 /DNA_ID=CAMNT_0000513505 /DNA_START=94 /DNA_END=1302 /DNA_ORIENTATION=- /assembly_acc=CAM_ASM_000147
MAMRTGLEGCGLPFGTLYNAPVRIHWTFFFNFLFQVIYAIVNHTSSWKYGLMVALIWGPLALMIIYIHEVGHLYANKKYGGTTYKATLWPLGGFSECYIEKCTCMQEFFVALAGPLTHIPQFFIWLIIMLASSHIGIDYYKAPFSFDAFDNGGADDFFAELGKQMLNFNLVIFILNLFIPVYPLDAARMMASLLVQCGLSTDRSCLALIIFGALLGLGCFIYGIMGIVNSSNDAITYLLAGIFVLYTIYGLFQYYNRRKVTSHPLFDADCYRERRTYVGGSNGVSRNYTGGRATDGAPRSRADIENGKKAKNRQPSTFLNPDDPNGFKLRKTKEVKPRASESQPPKPPNMNKKMSYGKALKKAQKMKMGELKRECEQRGIYTSSFVEKVQFEEAYAKSFSNK